VVASGCQRAAVVAPPAAASAASASAAAAGDAHPDLPTLRPADRVRLTEALRLAEQLRDSVWSGWSAAPFATLLVTPDHEFLLRHPAPTPEFLLVGPDPLLRSEVRVRPRQFPPNMAAAFPAVGGVSTIVIGQPESTGHASARWVLTVLHEHFHQLQYAQPGYHTAVEALDLTGGDRTGMWMLNYPFPYDSAGVQHRFATMAGALADALEAEGDAKFAARLVAFDAARRAFRASVPERDHRYFAFQAWQEGIARYTEYRLARLAVERYRPTAEFLALPEETSFAAAAEELRRGIVDGLRRADLGRQQRVAFYPFGAAMGLLLDRATPGWQARYHAEPFDLEAYLPPR
jgi:hypothetical protein